MQRLPPLRVWVACALVALVVVIGHVVHAPVATAHAEVRISDPAAGGVAAAGLDEISLTFISLDPEGPVRVQVLDADGTDVAAGEPEVQARDSIVTVPTQPLEVGVHTVRWAADSSDGDGRTTGGFSFEVEASGGGSPWILWLAAAAIPLAFVIVPRLSRRSR